MKSLEVIDLKKWEEKISAGMQEKAVTALEGGKVIYMPHLAFPLDAEELLLITPEKADPSKKNVSYDHRSDSINGALGSSEELTRMKGLIKRYSLNARGLLEKLIPHYTSTLIQGKTSLRPVEIEGRKSSVHKDDTRLHVDSFPSNPVKGQRILRVFTNINPEGKPRVWRVGEPFENVVKTFAPKTKRPLPGVSYLMKLFGLTKDIRTPYDHYMLQIHNAMKEDDNYQKTASQEEIRFPAGCSWIVFTDQVSHAALAGRGVLEQTFYLPAHGLKNLETAPLKVLERYYQTRLV
jgi:hypothetical protein